MMHCIFEQGFADALLVFYLVNVLTDVLTPTRAVRGLEEGVTYVFEVESRGGGGASGRAVVYVEPEGQRPRGARAVVLAALVAAILLVAVAVASWHGGRACGKRRSEKRAAHDSADRKGSKLH